MENTGASTPEEAVRPLVASLSISGATNPPAPHVPSPTHHSTAEDGGLREACRTGCIAAIDAALRLGTSISTVPVASVVPKRKPIAVVGGSTGGGSNGERLGDAVVVKALTLQLAARGRQVGTFSHLLSIGARLDEPGTSVDSIRSLIRLVTHGPDAPALLRLFFGAHLAHQLDQEMRNEALLGLMQGCTPPPRSSPAPAPAPSLDEQAEFARALLDDFGASPDFFRGFARRCTSTLSAAVRTLSPDLVRLLLDHGACPDGPPDLQPPPVSARPFHVPLCALAHALAGSLLDPHVQAALRQIADVLLDRGADISICVPYLGPLRGFLNFTNPLVVFLDTIDCWDDDGGGPQALDALRFLLDRGMNPDRPPIHAAQEPGRPNLTYPELLRSGHYSLWSYPRHNPLTDLLDKWGLGKLATPAFASALEMLAGYHPSNRGGIAHVAEVLAKYDHYKPSPASSSSSLSSSAPENTTMITPQTQDDIILDAWRRIISSTARLLAADELGEFFHDYVLTKASCPRFGPRGYLGYHGPGVHKIGDLATTTVAALLAAGADVNHRRRPYESWRQHDERPTALHSICLWLAGRGHKEQHNLFGWQRDCSGFRHTPDRAGFIRFLVEECGADPRARFQGRTPAEILVQLRRPELDAEETWEGPSGRDMEVVAAARRELVAFLEEAAAETV